MNDAEGVANKRDSNRLKDYLLLIKPSLSIMVVFSSVISYLLAPKVVSYNWQMILLLFAGGMLITGSANAINQVVEKDTDAMMKRTSKRPVAARRMSVAEGWAFALISGVVGVLIVLKTDRFTKSCFGFNMLVLLFEILSKVQVVRIGRGAIGLNSDSLSFHGFGFRKTFLKIKESGSQTVAVPLRDLL